MRENPKGSKGRGVSLDAADAIDVGLFGPGKARIDESIFTTYDYQGTSRRPPLVWLITFSRPGEGKKRETYEQPYTIGKGWDVSKDGRELIGRNGQAGLPKTCNAMLYLVKPLIKALKAAKIELDLTTGDPSVLEGMEVVLDRVDQEERNIRDDKDDRGGRDKDRDRGRGRDRDDDDRGGRGRGRDRDEDRGPRTILIIDEVLELGDGEKPARSAKRGKDEDEDDEKPRHKNRSKDDDDDDTDDKDDEKPKRGAKGKNDDDDEDKGSDGDGDQDEDDAVEAIIAAVEKGPVAYKDLEDELSAILKKNKRAEAIIDLATSKALLKQEKGWTFDGKTIDAEDTGKGSAKGKSKGKGKADDDDEEAEDEKPRRSSGSRRR